MTPPYEPYEKAAFLAPFNEVQHLHAVMNDPCDERQVLIVNITSTKVGKYHDPACVLNAGDHEFITHESYVLYRCAQTMRAGHIANMVDKKYYLTKADWHPQIFDRIVAGLRESEDVKQRILSYAQKNNIV